MNTSAPTAPGMTMVAMISSGPSKYIRSWNSGRAYHSGRAR